MLLQVQDLFHRFPSGRWGLQGANLTLQEGTFTILTGANGSGKTLLLKHLVGLEQPASGEILLKGRRVAEDWNWVRRSIGFVFQDADSQIIETTVEEDVAFGPRHSGIPKVEIKVMVENAIESCGLAGREKEITSVLSGGEKRRLTLAGVLVLGSELLILDEPFTGLDQPGTVMLLKILLALKEAGKSLLVVTHELEKCLAHADRLVLMKEGRTLAEGTPEDLWDRIPSAGVHRPRVPASDIRRLTWLEG